MSTRELRKRLERLHSVRLDLARRDALQAELLEGYRRRARAAPRRPRSLVPRRLAALAAAVAGLLVVTQAPAYYPVVVGQRIVIADAPPDFDWPSGRVLREQMPALAPGVEARLWAYRPVGGGSLTLLIDLFEERRADQVVERLRAAFPSLRSKEISVRPLEAEARGKLIDLLGHELHYRPAPDAVRRAWQELERQQGGAHD